MRPTSGSTAPAGLYTPQLQISTGIGGYTYQYTNDALPRRLRRRPLSLQQYGSCLTLDTIAHGRAPARARNCGPPTLTPAQIHKRRRIHGVSVQLSEHSPLAPGDVFAAHLRWLPAGAAGRAGGGGPGDTRGTTSGLGESPADRRCDERLPHAHDLRSHRRYPGTKRGRRTPGALAGRRALSRGRRHVRRCHRRPRRLRACRKRSHRCGVRLPQSVRRPGKRCWPTPPMTMTMSTPSSLLRPLAHPTPARYKDPV